MVVTEQGVIQPPAAKHRHKTEVGGEGKGSLVTAVQSGAAVDSTPGQSLSQTRKNLQPPPELELLSRNLVTFLSALQGLKAVWE